MWLNLYQFCLLHVLLIHFTFTYPPNIILAIDFVIRQRLISVTEIPTNVYFGFLFFLSVELKLNLSDITHGSSSRIVIHSNLQTVTE